MKGLLVGGALVLAVAMSGCIIETDNCPLGQHEVAGVCVADATYCWEYGTCTIGASCDYYGDMDCVSNTVAWWCSPGGYIQQVDCITDVAANGGCADSGQAYAACGSITGCQDARCLCSNNPAVCTGSITIGGCTGAAHCGP
jgi:hypothetical protein